jgi:hypothetical protein
MTSSIDDTYLAAEKDGHLEDLPTNHSPKFLPPLRPTLRTGTEALITAALAWLAPDREYPGPLSARSTGQGINWRDRSAQGTTLDARQNVGEPEEQRQ